VSKFPVINIPVINLSERTPKLEGAIDKYWLNLPNIGRSLVKADLRGAWVEKITVDLAERIGLPVAGCELVERADGLKMIASPNFLYDYAEETPGEKLLVNALGKNYLYTPDAILSVVDNAGISLPSGFATDSTISKASDLITGYLIFDSWIGNIDRHAKNWGIQQFLDGRKELLPTYDHGLSLGVRMPEDKLPLDLTDFSGTVRSSIQGEVGGALSMNGLASRLLELRPKSATFWIDRIGAIDRSGIETIFDRIPDGWTSDVRAVFTIDLLVASCDRLLILASERSQTQTQSQLRQLPTIPEISPLNPTQVQTSNPATTSPVTLADLNDWKDENNQIEHNPETGSLADINNLQSDDTQTAQYPTEGTLADMNLSDESDVESSDEDDDNLGDSDRPSL
jgi:hypothetical protein